MAKLYQRLATLADARINCLQRDPQNIEWYDRHTAEAERLTKAYMPSGSGIDSGTTILLDRSNAERLVFRADYHHMDPNGYYDGWTEHNIVVRASLAFEIEITVTGRDRNDIKEYYQQVFRDALTQEITEWHTQAITQNP